MLKPRTVFWLAAAGAAGYVVWRWQKQRLIEFDQSLFSDIAENKTLLSPGRTGVVEEKSATARPIQTKIHRGAPPARPAGARSIQTTIHKDEDPPKRPQPEEAAFTSTTTPLSEEQAELLTKTDESSPTTEQSDAPNSPPAAPEPLTPEPAVVPEVQESIPEVLVATHDIPDSQKDDSLIDSPADSPIDSPADSPIDSPIDSPDAPTEPLSEPTIASSVLSEDSQSVEPSVSLESSTDTSATSIAENHSAVDLGDESSAPTKPLDENQEASVIASGVEAKAEDDTSNDTSNDEDTSEAEEDDTSNDTSNDEDASEIEPEADANDLDDQEEETKPSGANARSKRKSSTGGKGSRSSRRKRNRSDTQP